MQFERWLNSDYPPYAYQTVDVSNNGTTWTNIYTNPSGQEVSGSSWQKMTYDISSVADNHSTVYIRWGYQIGSSGVFPSSGWNIDDVLVTGLPMSPLSVTINQAAGQADPTRNSPINFTVVFSEPVTDFATGDVTFTGGTAPGTLVGTVTGSGDHRPTTWPSAA